MDHSNDNGRDEYYDGESFYHKGQYKQAQNKYLASAEKGNLEAQLKVGSFYRSGDCGFEKDLFKAIKWLSKAADQGNASANKTLGHMYTYENTPIYDMGIAVTYFKKALDLGNFESAGYLGIIYMDDDFTERNLDTAKYYFNIAISNDFALGYYGRGLLAEQAKDTETARSYYLEAGEKGYDRNDIVKALNRLKPNGIDKAITSGSAANTIIVVAVILLVIILLASLK